MSARKVAVSKSAHQVAVHARHTWLRLPSSAVLIHKNGIEFRSATPFSPWAEMTLTLRSPRDSARVHCSGVVISSTGNKHTGYHVSMVFTGISKQAEARLNALAFNR
jgi:hypothetical protein